MSLFHNTIYRVPENHKQNNIWQCPINTGMTVVLENKQIWYLWIRSVHTIPTGTVLQLLSVAISDNHPCMLIQSAIAHYTPSHSQINMNGCSLVLCYWVP